MSDRIIAAIATPMAQGAIGIIRLSGEGSANVVDRIFRPASGQSISKRPTHTITFGIIFDNNTGDSVDECLVSLMRAPKSYTGEEVCEINCHGGVAVCEYILELCLKNGAALAEPGEFTKRAFLNGRMDLTRAEAVIDIITAHSPTAIRFATAQLSGTMQKHIEAIRDRIITLCADILVEVEYPEDDVEKAGKNEVYSTICNILEQINKLYNSFEAGKAIKEGISTAIVGKPNVGKSSLLNLLVGDERAIVTDVAGTTRDIVEETVRLGRVTLKLRDTAGIRSTYDKVESIGVNRAIEALLSSELVLCVFDSSQRLDDQDYAVIEKIDPAHAIAVINKTDLPKNIDYEYINSRFSRTVYISAATGEGIDDLISSVEDIFLKSLNDLEIGEVVTSRRQRESLRRARNAVITAMTGVQEGFTPDIVSIDLTEAADALGEITGKTASDDVIDSIFSRFCLGK